MTTEELEARVEALEARQDALVPETPPIDPNTLYVAKEASKRIRCNSSHIYSLIASGDLASIRIGHGQGGLRVLGSDLLAFLNSRRQGGPEPRMNFKRLGL